MRRLGWLLALCAIAAPDPANAVLPPDGCSLDLAGPVGRLTVTAWTTRPLRPRYSLTWVTSLALPGAQLQIVPWGADTVAPPPNRTQVFIYLLNPGMATGSYVGSSCETPAIVAGRWFWPAARGCVAPIWSRPECLWAGSAAARQGGRSAR